MKHGIWALAAVLMAEGTWACSVSYELGEILAQDEPEPGNGAQDGGQAGSPMGQGGAGSGGLQVGPRSARLVAGAVHVCLETDGELHCWGDGGYGQLGDGTLGDSGTPQRVPLTGAVRSASRGFWATQCVVYAFDSGDAACWGRNNQGQVDGSGLDIASPQAISLPAPAREIATGTWHACALLTDERVACWGSNGDGQLGDGTTEDRAGASLAGEALVPPDVARLTLGAVHSCALTVGGALYCWGANSSAQVSELGGSSVTKPTFVLDGIRDVAAGAFHNCVVDASSDVLCFGDNEFGQSGNSSGHLRTVDLPAPALAVAAHARHSCALLEEGQVYCWGRSAAGEIGQVDVGSGPVEVAGLPPLVELVTTEGGGCGLAADDRVWCWGELSPSRLGTMPPSAYSVE